jgi:hypothetical protein
MRWTHWAILTVLIASAGCCRWCEHWCPNHPAAAAYCPQPCQPCQPCCCVPCCPPGTMGGVAPHYQPQGVVPTGSMQPQGWQRTYTQPVSNCCE